MMIMKTLMLADILLYVATLSHGPEGFYCVDRSEANNGTNLLMYFEDVNELIGQNLSFGKVTLYGLTQSETVVSAPSHFVISSGGGGHSEQHLSIYPFEEFERFCDATGLASDFLSKNGKYYTKHPHYAPTNELTDFVAFPAYGSLESTKLSYEACYESLADQGLESVEGFEFIFGQSANGIFDRTVTIKKDGKVLGIYEIEFDGLKYPFRISLVKKRGRHFDGLLDAFEKGSKLSKERVWMKGKAISYDPLNKRIILHK